MAMSPSPIPPNFSVGTTRNGTFSEFEILRRLAAVGAGRAGFLERRGGNEIAGMFGLRSEPAGIALVGRRNDLGVERKRQIAFLPVDQVEVARSLGRPDRLQRQRHQFPIADQRPQIAPVRQEGGRISGLRLRIGVLQPRSAQKQPHAGIGEIVDRADPSRRLVRRRAALAERVLGVIGAAGAVGVDRDPAELCEHLADAGGAAGVVDQHRKRSGVGAARDLHGCGLHSAGGRHRRINVDECDAGALAVVATQLFDDGREVGVSGFFLRAGAGRGPAQQHRNREDRRKRQEICKTAGCAPVDCFMNPSINSPTSSSVPMQHRPSQAG